METQLNFVLKLSLKEMALRKLVVCLWNEDDILNVIGKDPGSDFIYWREIVEVQVKNNVSKLAIPKSLREQMMRLVEPIGLDIVTWKRFHENYIRYRYFDVRILKQLQWSCIGAIDNRKTAEKLVRLEMFDIVKRYRLACFYCLVDYIPFLWKELNENGQRRFYKYDPKCFLGFLEIKLEYVWPYILEGEQSVLDEISRRKISKSFIQYILECAAYSGNKAAIEHFFPLLTAEEQDSFLVKAVCNVIDNVPPWSSPPLFTRGRIGDALCYLLSMMRPEKQMQVLRKNPREVLGCLLGWPWYDLFVDLTNIVWNLLPKHNYYFSVFLLLNGVKLHLCCCSNLLQKLFLFGPSELKRDFVIYEYQQFHFIFYFVCNQDTESIKVVLRNLNASDRVDLVSVLEGFEEFNDFMGTDKWHLVELCFREAIQSKEDKETLKKRFIKAFNSSRASEGLLLRKREWEEFIELLEVADATSANKRSLKDAAVIKAEKTSH